MGGGGPTQEVGRIRVVKTAWRWYYPEYGYEPVANLQPTVVPLYDLNLLDPVRYASNNPNYANFLNLTANIPGIAGVKLRVLCQSSTKDEVVISGPNGMVDFSYSDRQALGCSRFEDLTAEPILSDYGVPDKSNATYNYFFPDQGSNIVPVSQFQSDYAATVFIGYRPTIIGRITDLDKQPVTGATVCLFYRQPAASEPCNKEGLSVQTKTDSAGRYIIYASWGDYVQKGGGTIAQVVVEAGGGRHECTDPFAISGANANLVNCNIDPDAFAAEPSGLAATQPRSQPRARRTVPKTPVVYKKYGQGPSTHFSKDCPPETQQPNQIAQPAQQQGTSFLMFRGNRSTSQNMLCAVPQTVPAGPGTIVPLPAVPLPPKAPAPPAAQQFISCEVLKRRIAIYQQHLADTRRKATIETEQRWVDYWRRLEQDLIRTINALKRQRCS